jgi:hypothetical protein
MTDRSAEEENHGCIVDLVHLKKHPRMQDRMAQRALFLAIAELSKREAYARAAERARPQSKEADQDG